MKVVKILWEDSCNSNLNWVIKEDVEVELVNIDSFGVVVKETDEFVSIAQNYGSEPEQYSNIVTIPRGCIKEIFVIHNDNYVRQGEQKPVEPQQNMLSQEKYAKAVDECIYGEKSEWGDEDEKMYQSVLWHIKNSISNGNPDSCSKCDLTVWFEALKNRILPRVNQEWSEEDEKYLNIVYSAILSAGVQGIYDYHKVTNNDVRKWLNKSLRPQKQWKPTKAMLEALKWAKCEFHPDCPETMEQLKYLYNELKQLYYDRT